MNIPPNPNRKAFNRRASLVLDQVIVALERAPHPIYRAWLRVRKRIIEARYVTPYTKERRR